MLKRSAKQLDKFSQSIGEKFFSEQKTELSSDFKEREKDAETTRRGVERLHATSSSYYSWISKRKTSADPYPPDGQSSKEVFYPAEALGLVMGSYGTEVSRKMARSRAFGENMIKFGRARAKVSAAQDTYVASLEADVGEEMESAMDIVKDYAQIRKKLDSRRLALDAAQRKLRQTKKENRALENEVDIAQARFEEIEELAHERMNEVAEIEGRLEHIVTAMLEAELRFVNEYQAAIQELKSQWDAPLGDSTPLATRPRSKSEATVAPKSLMSRARSSTAVFRPSLSARTSTSGRNDASDEEREQPKSGGRHRSSSTASAGSKRFVPSLGSFGRKSMSSSKLFIGNSEKKYGKFVEDEDRDDLYERPAPVGRTRSQSALSSFNNMAIAEHAPTSPSMRRNLTETISRTTPTANRSSSYVAPPPPVSIGTSAERVRAKFAYVPSAGDELELMVGMIIEVTSKVSEDWWIGEADNGDSGLFPASYTEPLNSPALPPRRAGSSSAINVPPYAGHRFAATGPPNTQDAYTTSEDEGLTTENDTEDDRGEDHQSLRYNHNSSSQTGGGGFSNTPPRSRSGSGSTGSGGVAGFRGISLPSFPSRSSKRISQVPEDYEASPFGGTDDEHDGGSLINAYEAAGSGSRRR